MKKTITVLPGDGIGPEIMEATLMVLNEVCEQFGHEFLYNHALIGGAAYALHAEHLPQNTLDVASNCDAILFGSVGGPVDAQNDPKWKGAEKNSLLGIRKYFNFNINLRPTIVWPELAKQSVLRPDIIGNGFELIIVRELSEGLYFGEHNTEVIDGQRVAHDIMEYHENTIRQVVEFAFQMADKGNHRLCSVDKANVLDCSVLWRSIVDDIAQRYSKVKVEHMYVDNAAMQLIKNPRHFDVIVTENTFGDILSDLSSVLPGSLGLLGSASFNNKGFGLYEPSGGSAPDIASKGIANPIGMLLSAAMMLRYSFELEREAKCIENAIQKTISTHRTLDIWEAGLEKVSTKGFVEFVIKNLTR